MKLSSLNSNASVKSAIRYISGLNNYDANSDTYSINLDQRDYITKAERQLSDLTKELAQSKSYDSIANLWVMFFGIANKDFSTIQRKQDKDSFKVSMDKFIDSILYPNIESLDYKVLKKGLSVKDIFTSNMSNKLLLEPTDKLCKSIEANILNGLAASKKSGNDVSTIVLETLSIGVRRVGHDKFLESIIQGRFDKAEYGLSNTVIIGDNCGLYGLLNGIDNNSKPLLQKVASDDYIDSLYAETIRKAPHKAHKADQKLVIGKGSFGTVRFAIALSEEENTKLGDIVCIKKSKYIGHVDHKDGAILSLLEVQDSTLGDYVSDQFADYVYAPKVFDMSITVSQQQTHNKGYVIMDVIPKNNGDTTFKKPEYQTWAHQKPYLLDIFKGIQKLVDQGIAMFDLKPANTLYDPEKHKGVLIDLGGVIKVANKTALESFDFEYVQYTPKYTAPEIKNHNQGQKVNVLKAFSYTFGKIIDDVTRNTDYSNKQEIQDLVRLLLDNNPLNRITIEEAIQRLENIGNPQIVQDPSHYIQILDEKIKNDPTNLGLNGDIEETRKLYINTGATTLDPYLYKDLEKHDIHKKIKEFELSDQEVFLLLGRAGSGKSITLQLKFIDAVKSWKQGDPVPFYFNLANNTIDIKKAWENLNKILETNIPINLLYDNKVTLYIDSFDESNQKTNLVVGYFKALGDKEGNKTFISCRSDYLQGDRDDIWFTPRSNKLEKYYVAPLDNTNEEKLAQNIDRYIHHQQQKKEQVNLTVEQYIEKLKESNLLEAIETSYMFYMTLSVLPHINKPTIKKWDVYEQYIANYTNRELQKADIRDKEAINKQFSQQDLYNTLGKLLASSIHTATEARLNYANNQEIFERLKYDPMLSYKNQIISSVLKMLPMRVEVRGKAPNEEITIGFAHLNIKNYFLIKEILNELNTNKKDLLAHRRVVEDVELIRSIVEVIEDSEELQQKLMQGVYDTKIDKSDSAVIYSCNAITILNAARFLFNELDLSGVSIKGANVRNGFFVETDFTDADLSNVNLSNTKLIGAKCKNTNMKDVDLGILPDLSDHDNHVKYLQYSSDGKFLISAANYGTVIIYDTLNYKIVNKLKHTGSIKSVAFSHEGKFLAYGSEGKSNNDTIQIWDANGKCLNTLVGHTKYIKSICHSLDGKLLASGSGDHTVILWDTNNWHNICALNHDCSIEDIAFAPNSRFLAVSEYSRHIVKVWNIENRSVLGKLIGHKSAIYNVVYSPNGKLIGSGSEDFSARVWNTNNYKCLKTFEGHTSPVRSVAFAPDCKYLASGSSDHAVKIWSIKSGVCLATMSGHTREVGTLSYSPNGKFLASGSDDCLIKIWQINSSNNVTYNNLNKKAHLSQVSSVAFSPDGNYLASSDAAHQLHKSYEIKIWDTLHYKHVKTLVGHTYSIHEVTYSPDSKCLASASIDRSVKIWDPLLGICLHTLSGNTHPVYGIVFSPDGKYLVSASRSGLIKIWETKNYSNIHNIKHGNSEHPIVWDIVFSPDGKHFATASYDHTVNIWNTQTYEQVKVLSYKNSVSSITYSSDGKFLAFGVYDGIIQVWNAFNYQFLGFFGRHGSAVWSLVYSPNSKFLASASDDQSIRIWSSSHFSTSEENRRGDSGLCLQTLEGHNDEIKSICFSPNGDYLVSGSDDSTVKIWKVYSCGRFMLWNEISASESHMLCYESILNNVSLSSQNKRIFEQRKSSVKNVTIIVDDTLSRDINPEIDAQYTNLAEPYEEDSYKDDLLPQNGSALNEDPKLARIEGLRTIFELITYGHPVTEGDKSIAPTVSDDLIRMMINRKSAESPEEDNQNINRIAQMLMFNQLVQWAKEGAIVPENTKPEADHDNRSDSSSVVSILSSKPDADPTSSPKLDTHLNPPMEVSRPSDISSESLSNNPNAADIGLNANLIHEEMRVSKESNNIQIANDDKTSFADTENKKSITDEKLLEEKPCCDNCIVYIFNNKVFDNTKLQKSLDHISKVPLTIQKTLFDIFVPSSFDSNNDAFEAGEMGSSI